MKTKNLIGGLIVAIGMLMAIGLVDNSNNEMTIRFAGIAVIVVGAYIAEAFDFQTKRKDAR